MKRFLLVVSLFFCSSSYGLSIAQLQAGENAININGTTWDFSGKSLTSLDGLNDLDGVGKANVETLQLHDNNIKDLPLGIFDAFTGLQFLTFYNNQITSLPVGIFNNNSTLRGLYFYDNNLTTLTSGLFDQNPLLLIIQFHNNNITILGSGLFDNNTVLTQLYLHNNTIEILPDGIFDNIPNGTTIKLYDNPVISSIANTANQTDLEDTDGITGANLKTLLAAEPALSWPAPGAAMTFSQYKRKQKSLGNKMGLLYS